MADLSVYGKVNNLSDLMFQRERDKFNRRMMERQVSAREQLASSGGQDPAAIKIVRAMQSAATRAKDPNLSEAERAQAEHEYSMLNQVSKSYAVDRGMEAHVPDFYGNGWQGAMQMPPTAGADAVMGRASNATQAGQFENLDGILAEMDGQQQFPRMASSPNNPPSLGAVSEVPGYTSIMSARKGAERQAEKNVDLNMDPIIEHEKALQKGRAENIVDLEAKGAKAVKQANTMVGYLDMAEQLLPEASSGLLGTGMSAAKGLAGFSDETTQANEQLRLISGWLMANVPRMEGPQSNFDVLNYQKMAADVGNTMKPTGDRLAALQSLRRLQAKYASINGSADMQPQTFGTDSAGGNVVNWEDLP
jgi:hypothetical protein